MGKSASIEVSDDLILERFNEKSTKTVGFNSLVTKYQEKLYWQVRRLVLHHDDANDVIQNVFIKVWNNLHKFRADSKLSTWLYRIAVNESITYLNQRKKRISYSTEDEELFSFI